MRVTVPRGKAQGPSSAAILHSRDHEQADTEGLLEQVWLQQERVLQSLPPEDMLQEEETDGYRSRLCSIQRETLSELRSFRRALGK
jgi:hypothetical protein